MELIQGIRERRSINFFETGRELSDDQLRELLEVANLSPSSFNLQPWKVVVVRDSERKKVLRQCAMNQPKVRLCVRKSNAGAVDLYLREGYKPVDLWKSYYVGGEDALVMEKVRD
jgi:nitroreductase